MKIGERVLPRGILLATALAGVALAGCPRVPETQPPPTPIAASGQPRPVEAQKPAGGEKVAIRLKPEELFRALLTTPFQPNELPLGVTAKENIAGTVHPTAEPFKAVGQVNVLVREDNPRFNELPNGGISYFVFPDATNARGAYDALTNRSGKRDLRDFGYPAVLISEFGSNMVVAISVENLVVTATLPNLNPETREQRTIAFAKAALAHLQRVGR